MEDAGHIWKCEGIEMMAAMEKKWGMMQNEMLLKKQVEGLRMLEIWKEMLTPGCQDKRKLKLSEVEKTIVEDQEVVGWEQLFVGRAVQGWRKIIRQGRSKRLSAGKIGWGLGKWRWCLRNEVMHEENIREEGEKQIRTWKEIRIIREEVEQGKRQVRKEDEWVFAVS